MGFARHFPSIAPWGLTPTLALPHPHEAVPGADEALVPPCSPLSFSVRWVEAVAMGLVLPVPLWRRHLMG